MSSFFKQKTACEILADWSSDVCSSDLLVVAGQAGLEPAQRLAPALGVRIVAREQIEPRVRLADQLADVLVDERSEGQVGSGGRRGGEECRSRGARDD